MAGPIPGLAVIRRYQRAWLPRDLLAGVTVAAYLVPQVMAYAEVAGLPPATGLWAALPALVLYPLLGSSASLSMGPESTTALMTAVAIGPLAAGNSARYAQLAASLALLTGLLAAAAWLLRLGFLADLLSRPVLVGYLAGVGLIMIADQLGRVTGVPVTGELFAAQLSSFAGGLGSARPGTMRAGGRGTDLLVRGALALAPCAGPAAGHRAGHGGRGRIRAERPRAQRGRPDPGRAAGTGAARCSSRCLAAVAAAGVQRAGRGLQR